MSYYNLLIEADKNGLDRYVVIKDRIKELTKNIKKFTKDYNSSADTLNAYFIHRQRMKCINEIQFLEGHKNIPIESKITDEDIYKANQYPIEQLIDFNRYGKSLSWCHDDRSPSLSLWKGKNKARCFVCGITFRPIDVLVKRDNYSFIEAVKSLL